MRRGDAACKFFSRRTGEKREEERTAERHWGIAQVATVQDFKEQARPALCGDSAARHGALVLLRKIHHGDTENTEDEVY